jgi:hypothetical protein
LVTDKEVPLILKYAVVLVEVISKLYWELIDMMDQRVGH